MDDESDDYETDGLRSGWGGESRQERGWRNESGSWFQRRGDPSQAAHAKINRKIENSTRCKIVTREDFNLKLGTRDYGADITHRTTLGSNRQSGDSPPPNCGNITLLWHFLVTVCFSRLRAQVEPSHWYLCWMAQMACFRLRKCFWGSARWVEIFQKNSPKRGVNRQFQAKTPKSLHRNISGTINPTN